MPRTTGRARLRKRAGRWVGPLLLAGLVVLNGCGSTTGSDNGGGGGGASGGGSLANRGEPVFGNLSAGVNVTLPGGGDDYLLVLASNGAAGSTLRVNANGGGTVVAPLPAPRLRSVDRKRDTVRPGNVGLASQLGNVAPGSRQAVGSTRVFAVDPPGGTASNVNATLRAAGANGLVYVANSVSAVSYTNTNVQDTSTAFNAITATDTAVFGAPSDVDGNGRVIILVTPLPNTIYGYFDGADITGGGNGGEILYVLAPTLTAPYVVLRESILGTAAHELQHLINANSKLLVHRLSRNEDTWLNEALSFNAEQECGYGDVPNGDPAAANDWEQSPESGPLLQTSGDYTVQQIGGFYLFVRYLHDRFGAAIFKQLVQSTDVGRTNVQNRTGVTFGQLLADFGAALYLHGTGLSSDARYRFTTFNPRGTYPGANVALAGPRARTVNVASANPQFSADVPSGGFRYLRLKNVPATGCTLNLSGNANIGTVLIRVPTGAP